MQNTIPPIDYKVTNENDSKAMSGIIRRTAVIIGGKDFTTIFDKDYHTGSELKYAAQQDLTIITVLSDVASHAPATAYDIDHFKYNKEQDSSYTKIRMAKIRYKSLRFSQSFI